MKEKKNGKTNPIQEEINENLRLMSITDRGTKEYEQYLDNVEKLMDVLNKGDKKKADINWNTVAAVAGNLLGIGLILFWEEGHVVTSKALGFVLKGRV